MKKFEKIYVGKGRNPQPEMEITRITVKMSELQSLIYEYNDNQYVTLEVRKMKSADNYGNTHTVYGSRLVEETTPKPRRRKKAPAQTEEVPF